MADKAIHELPAAETIQNEDSFVLEQDGVAKKLTGDILGDYVYAAAAEKIAEVNQAVTDAQAAVDELEEQKNTIAQAVAAMADLGTDTSLSTTGMAADAKVTGDRLKLVNNALNTILDYVPYTITETEQKWRISPTNKWQKITTASIRCVFITIPDTWTNLEITASENGDSVIAFLKTLNPVDDETPDFSDDYPSRVSMTSGTTQSFAVPSDAHYLYVATKTTTNTDIIPVIKYLFYFTDTELVVSGKPADAKATGDKIGELQSKIAGIKQLSVNNLLDNSENRSTETTSYGISYSVDYNTGIITVGAGTTTGTSFCNIFGYTDRLREGVVPGKHLFIHAEGLVKNSIGLRVYTLPSAAVPESSRVIYGSSYIYIPKECTAVLIRVEVPEGITIASSVTVQLRILNGESSVALSNAEENDGLKVLVFGNSFSYSTLNYLPLVLREIMPEKHILLGILYRSGETITGHLNGWNNNTVYSTYATFDTARGTYNYVSDSVTGKSAVYKEKWDYIILQNTAGNASDESKYGELEQLADKITSYINYPVTYLYNIQQSRPSTAPASSYPSKYQNESLYPTGRDRSNGVIEDHFEYVKKLMNDCIISDVLPTGTAVQNARTTYLEDLGTYGDMAVDQIGHLQNGLPVLIGSYTAAYKLCQLAGWKAKNYANPFIPTQEGLTALDFQSSHGECTGVTDANRLLAQKCALMAIKKPFEIVDMSSHERT